MRVPESTLPNCCCRPFPIIPSVTHAVDSWKSSCSYSYSSVSSFIYSCGLQLQLYLYLLLYLYLYLQLWLCICHVGAGVVSASGMCRMCQNVCSSKSEHREQFSLLFRMRLGMGLGCSYFQRTRTFIKDSAFVLLTSLANPSMGRGYCKYIYSTQYRIAVGPRILKRSNRCIGYCIVLSISYTYVSVVQVSVVVSSWVQRVIIQSTAYSGIYECDYVKVKVVLPYQKRHIDQDLSVVQ